MKYLIILLLFTGCTTITAQDDKAAAEEREFNDLVKKTSASLDLSAATQTQAESKQTQIVQQTVAKITTLKSEINQLKTELNEFKAALDSVSVDTGVSYNLLPVSKNKENR